MNIMTVDQARAVLSASSEMSLKRAVRKLYELRPVTLDMELLHKADGEIKSMKFADEHLFTIAVPAWVLREIVRYVEGKAAQ